MLFDQLRILDQEAKNLGLYWDDLASIFCQIQSECQEVLELSISIVHLKEELGDLLHAILCCPLFLEFNFADMLEDFVQQFDELPLPFMDSVDALETGLVEEIIEQVHTLETKSNYTRSSIAYYKPIQVMVELGFRLVHKSGFRCRMVIEESMQKFKRRLDGMALLARAQNLANIQGLSRQKKLALWEQVKKTEVQMDPK